ncbi:unnamed protein product [Linum tenue]|uniref:Ubiquitin-like protease family profile domain-containing protein n=1 Tax=Linum tenue TaxID=586396 RepID=A0AAV0NVI9_9ROSI|nr:unnamed protein product [Linum tenue]
MDLMPEVVRPKRGSHTDDQNPRQQCAPSLTMASEDGDHGCTLRAECAKLPDGKLEEAIASQRRTLANVGSKLPDGGRKLLSSIAIYEEERERRKSAKAAMAVGESKQFIQSANTSTNGAPGGSKEMASSEIHSQSRSGSLFSKKMEDNIIRLPRHLIENYLLCVLAALRKGNSMRVCHKMEGGKMDHQKDEVLNLLLFGRTREFPLIHSTLKGKVHLDIFLMVLLVEKRNLQSRLYIVSDLERQRETVVLLDDDDDEVLETLDCANETRDECLKDAKIYYPSRDDPECVEICFQDIDCLAPESFLTSPIMNFYIRYLEMQASPSQKATCDYHIFNTFFYNKLKQQLSRNGGEKESLFVKFRRWWKGVNLFDKAYILIPIHEDLHWSLVIICFPEKKDNRSGPMLLHLDSLKLHYSRVVLEDITSFLREEWQYLHQEVARQLDVEISDKIWKRLHDISSRRIEVPQQKNDYDCGIFVLYFMERFIDEAPERLKEVDLDMFGKQWFKPEEASRLRKKIRDLLKTEFRKLRKRGIACESLAIPSGGSTSAENSNSTESS